MPIWKTKTFVEIIFHIRFQIDQRKAFKRLKRFHVKPRTTEQIVDWALNAGTRGEFEISTMQIRDEILSLANTVAELQPKVILEIGTAFGGTLFIWSQLASELVITCDLSEKTKRSHFFRKFPPKKSRCKVEVLTGNSHAPEFRQRVIDLLGGRKVDFLFIDGDHTESGVTADYHDYRELVRPGGIIAFHDIVKRQIIGTNQVYHLWKQLRMEFDIDEYIKDPDQCGFGIGIIRVKDNPLGSSIVSSVD